MVETDLLNFALENLRKNSRIVGEWEPASRKNDDGIDGVVTLKIREKDYVLNVGIKKTLRNHQIYQIAETAEIHRPYLLVAEHIFPSIKEELREMGLAYLEANGNICLKEPDFFLWIDNQKPATLAKEPINRAFSKSGLKVIFHILRNKEFVNCPFREIARKADISLGNVNNVMNGLKQAGFLLKLNRSQYRLANQKVLLEKWMTGYAEKLQPALQLGRFRFFKDGDRMNWHQLALIAGKTYWGGEPAANMLTGYLKPEILTLYTDESRTELMKNYRLVPDDNGDVKAYRKFWGGDSEDRNQVDPLLVYTDIMNTGEGRCMETAKMIFDEYQFANKF